jgi:hypothetical protein
MMRVSAEKREQLLKHFQRGTAWPMLVLALAIVPIIVVIPMVADLSPSRSAALTGVDWLIWAAFAIEFAIALTIAPRKLSARVLRIGRVAPPEREPGPALVPSW